MSVMPEIVEALGGTEVRSEPVRTPEELKAWIREGLGTTVPEAGTTVPEAGTALIEAKGKQENAPGMRCQSPRQGVI